jgi:hypothetical protein
MLNYCGAWRKSDESISMSKNPMIGFAQELLRMAHSFHNGYHEHIDPSESNHIPQVMGFYSHPDSAELIVCCAEFESIDTIFKRNKDNPYLYTS